MKNILLQLLLVSFLAAVPAYANIFCDSSNSFYHIDEKYLHKSSDGGQTWERYISPVSAEAKAVFTENSDQTLNIFWLESGKLMQKESKNRGVSFSKSKPVILDFSPESFAIHVNNGIWHLFFSKDKHLYYSYSSDKGMAFSLTQNLSGSLPVQSFKFLASPGKFTVYFTAYGKIFNVESLNSGASFSNPREIYYSSGNTLLDLAKFKNDLAGGFPKPIWSEKTLSGQYEIKYLPQGTTVPIPIYSASYQPTSIEATALPEAMLLNFYQDIPEGSSPLILRVKNNGAPIREAQRIQIDPPKVYIGSLTYANKLLILTKKNGEISRSIFLNDPPEAELALPQNNFHANADKVRFKVNGSDPDQDSLILGLKISWDQNFAADKTWEFTDISPEADLPLPFPDGKYYVKAVVSDGLHEKASASPSIFYLDRVPPKIVISNEMENKRIFTSFPAIEIKGAVSEEAAITINGGRVSHESSGLFSKIIDLQSEINLVVCIASDKAGNSTSESFTVIFNKDAPRISLASPRADQYFKRGSTILVNAFVADDANDVLDGTQALISIDGAAVPANLFYDPEDQSIGGFINLPDNIPDGRRSFLIGISDSSGNSGAIKVPIIMDNAPPAVSKNSVSANSRRITIPFSEIGSGFDPGASIIKLFSGSSEVLGKTNIESSAVNFIPSQSLLDGSYRLEFSLRDMAGNSSSNESMILNVSSAQTLAAAAAAGDLKILSVENGPNPFSPSRNESAVVKYSLSASSDIEFYLFSIHGELLYKKIVNSAPAADSFSWDGRDASSGTVGSGVYPYILIAKGLNGGKDMKRGKIIVF